MKKCVFTICAKNYIGLAKILEKSIKRYNTDLDFYIFVADEFADQIQKLPDNALISHNVLSIPEDKWKEMSFKYDVTEFCTAIKPKCFEYIFNTLNYDQSIYLDPDIFVFNSLNVIFNDLEKYSIILTPHIINIEPDYSGDIAEKTILACGVYNLGFCALKKSIHSEKFIQWWANRLIDKCFINPSDSYFTDQRWIDMIPCFFDSNILKISQNFGLNLAPWNFFEREIFMKDGEYFVCSRNNKNSNKFDKLIFVHYSGYDYTKLKKGIIVQKNIPNINEYVDILPIIDNYKQEIVENKDVFDEFISLSYTYNKFDNGVSITSFHRRLYNGMISDVNYFENPFSTSEPNTFYLLLKQRKMFPLKAEIEKYNKNTPTVSNKISKVNKLFTYIYMIIGYDRFYLLIRLFKPYSKFETYSFLLKK